MANADMPNRITEALLEMGGKANVDEIAAYIRDKYGEHRPDPAWRDELMAAGDELARIGRIQKHADGEGVWRLV